MYLLLFRQAIFAVAAAKATVVITVIVAANGAVDVFVTFAVPVAKASVSVTALVGAVAAVAITDYVPITVAITALVASVGGRCCC